MSSLIENKKAHFNYEILETVEAGIELLGNEVKSIRKREGSLEGARVIVRGNEAFLVGATIPPYQPANTEKDYDPSRNRRLLLNRKEIKLISGAESKKGLTIIPISVYNKERKIKISVAIVRGKKKYDKRDSIKKRETDRDIRRTLKKE